MLLDLQGRSFADAEAAIRQALMAGMAALGARRATAWQVDRKRLRRTPWVSEGDTAAGTPAAPDLRAAGDWTHPWSRHASYRGSVSVSTLTVPFRREGIPAGLLHFEMDDPDQVLTEADRLFAVGLAHLVTAGSRGARTTSW